jgi:hypothetical protein
MKKNPKVLYGKIGTMWCPALNEYITFNRLGFQHLLRKRGIPRTKEEQERRFALLPFVKEIVGDPCAKFYYQKKTSFSRLDRHNKTIRTSNNAEFWRLSKEIDGKRINVVIRKINHGKKHFFSVY